MSQQQQVTKWKDLLNHRENTYGILDLSRFEFDVLVYIGANPLTTIQEIVGSHLFGKGTLSTVKRAVDTFKERQWLRVSRNDKDGRERLIMLTPEAESLL